MPQTAVPASAAQMLEAVFELVALNRLGIIVLILMVGACIWFAVKASIFARETRDLAELQVERSRELAAVQAERTSERAQLILDNVNAMAAELQQLRAQLHEALPARPAPTPTSTPAATVAEPPR